MNKLNKKEKFLNKLKIELNKYNHVEINMVKLIDFLIDDFCIFLYCFITYKI